MIDKMVKFFYSMNDCKFVNFILHNDTTVVNVLAKIEIILIKQDSLTAGMFHILYN